MSRPISVNEIVFAVMSAREANSLAMSSNLLLDCAENGAAAPVEHLDAHDVAGLQERRLRRAGADGFDRAKLGDAGVAAAALIDRPSRTAVGVLVRDGARADDGAGAERARLGGVRNQPREVEGHVDAGLDAAERPAVQVDVKRQMEPSAVPGRSHFFRRYGDHRESR